MQSAKVLHMGALLDYFDCLCITQVEFVFDDHGAENHTGWLVSRTFLLIV